MTLLKTQNQHNKDKNKCFKKENSWCNYFNSLNTIQISKILGKNRDVDKKIPDTISGLKITNVLNSKIHKVVNKILDSSKCITIQYILLLLLFCFLKHRPVLV